MIQQGLLTPRSLRLFFGCPLQKLGLDCYPYATNELLRQLRAFPGLRHLSLLACSLITGELLELLLPCRTVLGTQLLAPLPPSRL